MRLADPITVLVELPEGAPWWYVPILAGVFAITGVTIAQLVSYKLFKAKNERDEDRRWDKDRRDVYAKFIAASGQHLKQLVAYQRGYEKEVLPLPEERPTAVWEAYENFALIAPEALAKIAVRVLRSQMQFRRSLIQDLPSDLPLDERDGKFESLPEHRNSLKHVIASANLEYQSLRIAVRSEFGLEPLSSITQQVTYYKNEIDKHYEGRSSASIGISLTFF